MSTMSIWSMTSEISDNYDARLDDVRRLNPIHYNHFGDLVVMGYDQVKAVFADSENFRNFDFTERFKVVASMAANDPTLLEFAENLQYWLLFMNDERHAEQRRVVNKKFYEADYEEITKSAVNDLIALYKDRERADLVEISRRFSFLMISKIIDLDASEYDFIQKFAYVITTIFEKTLSIKDLKACAELSKEFSGYMRMTLDRHENELTDSLLIEMKKVMGSSSVHQLIATWEFLVNAAVETTSLLVTGSVVTLIENKHKIIDWKTKNVAAIAVEELIRYVSPIKWIPRKVRDDMVYEGFKLRKGQTVFVCIGSANRDPAVFENPQEFIPTRKPNPHIGFGYGIHHCLGARLSRFEMQKLIPELMESFPNIRFDYSLPRQWDNKFFFRGFKSLPVLLK